MAGVMQICAGVGWYPGGASARPPMFRGKEFVRASFSLGTRRNTPAIVFGLSHPDSGKAPPAAPGSLARAAREAIGRWETPPACPPPGGDTGRSRTKKGWYSLDPLLGGSTKHRPPWPISEYYVWKKQY